jgi:hypothetical protein
LTRRVAGGFDRLKARIVADARADLRKYKPDYVARLQAELILTNDLDMAIARAQPYLGSPLRKWPALLTAIFDVELVRGKVVECHDHLKNLRDSDQPEAGYWFAYHLDLWTFQSDAFINRGSNLYTKVIRAVLRHCDPAWAEFEKEIAAAVAVDRSDFGKVRHPLAHGLGAGVDAMTQHWEAVLAAPGDVVESPDFAKEALGNFYAQVNASRRKTWFRAMHRATLVLFARSEDHAGKVIDRIESLPK